LVDGVVVMIRSPGCGVPCCHRRMLIRCDRDHTGSGIARHQVHPQLAIAARAAGVMPLGFIGTVAGYKELEAFLLSVQRSRRSRRPAVPPGRVQALANQRPRRASTLLRARAMCALQASR
jgi:hypothetical protein